MISHREPAEGEQNDGEEPALAWLFGVAIFALILCRFLRLGLFEVPVPHLVVRLPENKAFIAITPSAYMLQLGPLERDASILPVHANERCPVFLSCRDWLNRHLLHPVHKSLQLVNGASHASHAQAEQIRCSEPLGAGCRVFHGCWFAVTDPRRSATDGSTHQRDRVQRQSPSR